MKSSVHIELPSGSDPFSTNTSLPKRLKIRKFQNLLKKLMDGGVHPSRLAASNSLSARPFLDVGTAQASAVVTTAAVQSGDTVTINGVALTATKHNSTGTCTFSSIANDDTVTINGLVLTAKTTVTDANTQFALGASDTAAAANCVTLVNANPLRSALTLGLVTATSAAGVVTFRAVTGGTGGDAITLASSNGTRAAVSGATLSGGATVANAQFDFGGSVTEQATALKNAVNACTTALIVNVVEATSAVDAVTIKARAKGLAGNAMTIATSNGTRLAITGGLSRLGGGTQTRLSF